MQNQWAIASLVFLGHGRSWVAQPLESVIKAIFGWQGQRRSLLLRVAICSLCCAVALSLFPHAAAASVSDDRYDGSIFPLYAGNGSIVPPRVSLKQSLSRSDRPTVLGFYLDDSKDCKQYAAVWSAVDAYYGRAVDIILLSVDSFLPQPEYAVTEPGSYYSGIVPQTVIFSQAGDPVLSVTGDTPFEILDDTIRSLFDLAPRSETVKLRRRSVNEQNLELVPEP
ncbi:MAG: thylakoid membrane photosystem I accumulation factor [Leptolyngbyaceae cyanobacterium]